MIKEAIEDYKRYRQDVEVNNRDVEVRGRAQCGGSRAQALPNARGSSVLALSSAACPACGHVRGSWSGCAALQVLVAAAAEGASAV